VQVRFQAGFRVSGSYIRSPWIRGSCAGEESLLNERILSRPRPPAVNPVPAGGPGPPERARFRLRLLEWWSRVPVSSPTEESTG
jgi:hypothetical protein